MEIAYESTKKPHALFLHGARQKDSVAASLCTVALRVRTGWSPVSLMIRARHGHALSNLSLVQHSLRILAQVLPITGMAEMRCVTGHHMRKDCNR
jgi:hypothetical protein